MSEATRPLPPDPDDASRDEFKLAFKRYAVECRAQGWRPGINTDWSVATQVDASIIALALSNDDTSALR